MLGWALEQLRHHEPDFAADGRLAVVDIEVLEPGLVRIQGIWNGRDHVVVITGASLSFLHRHRPGPISIYGAGAESVLFWTGPITTSMFGVGNAPGGLHIPSAPAPKIGRNDPCWCGSGRKYKKCHGT